MKPFRIKPDDVELTNQINFLSVHQIRPIHPIDGYSLWRCDLGNGRISVESAVLRSHTYNDGDGTGDYPVIQRLIGVAFRAIYETVHNITGFEESDYVHVKDLNTLCKYLDYTTPIGKPDFFVGLLVRAYHSSLGTSDRLSEQSTLDTLVRAWSRYNDIYVLDCAYADYNFTQKTVNN